MSPLSVHDLTIQPVCHVVPGTPHQYVPIGRTIHHGHGMLFSWPFVSFIDAIFSRPPLHPLPLNHRFMGDTIEAESGQPPSSHPSSTAQVYDIVDVLIPEGPGPPVVELDPTRPARVGNHLDTNFVAGENLELRVYN